VHSYTGLASLRSRTRLRVRPAGTQCDLAKLLNAMLCMLGSSDAQRPAPSLMYVDFTYRLYPHGIDNGQAV
jgi:hypothetical protein